MPVAWRMSADVCDPEDFSQDRFVALRAPGVADVAFGYQSDLGDLLQVDAHPRRRQGDVFETRIQQFADTVRASPTGRLRSDHANRRWASVGATYSRRSHANWRPALS